MSSEPPKYAIEIEAIKTPKGLVPTVESLKRIVKGLNLLDSDLGRMNLKMEANIRALLREVKTLQKLVADDTIASESSVERLGVLVDRFKNFEKTIDKVAKKQPESSSKELQKELIPTLTQAIQRLEEMVALFETRFEEFLRELQSNILVTVRQAVKDSPPKKKTSTKRKTKSSST